MNGKNYNMFEDCVARLFKEAGYSIEQNIEITSQRDVDIIAENNDVKYCIEVKYRIVRPSVFNDIL